MSDDAFPEKLGPGLAVYLLGIRIHFSEDPETLFSSFRSLLPGRDGLPLVQCPKTNFGMDFPDPWCFLFPSGNHHLVDLGDLGSDGTMPGRSAPYRRIVVRCHRQLFCLWEIWQLYLWCTCLVPGRRASPSPLSVRLLDGPTADLQELGQFPLAHSLRPFHLDVLPLSLGQARLPARETPLGRTFALARDRALPDRVPPPLAEGEHHRELEPAVGHGRVKVFRQGPELHSRPVQALDHLQPAGQPCKRRR